LSAPQDKPLARTSLANMYAIAKRYDEAIAEANAVLQEQPQGSAVLSAYYSLGTTYSLMKKYDKAIAALKKVISLAPELAEPHMTLAAIYWDAKKKSEYLQEYGILLNLNPKYAEQLKAAIEADKKK
jgi:tetratricopeptide (TPR) repeat protein